MKHKVSIVRSRLSLTQQSPLNWHISPAVCHVPSHIFIFQPLPPATTRVLVSRLSLVAYNRSLKSRIM